MYRYFVLCMVSIFLSACSGHDLAYYEKNIDKAETKLAACKAEVEAAYMTNDAERVEKILKDGECKAADEATRNHRNAEAKREQEAKEQAFNDAVKQEMSKISSLSIQELLGLRKEKCSGYGDSRTPECKAINTAYNEKEGQEIAALITQHPKDALVVYTQKRCSGLEYDETMCAISRKAANKQQDIQIEYYVNNREILKKDFNDCVHQYAALREARKNDEASALTKSFVCSTSLGALQNLKMAIYSFSNPIE